MRNSAQIFVHDSKAREKIPSGSISSWAQLLVQPKIMRKEDRAHKNTKT